MKKVFRAVWFGLLLVVSAAFAQQESPDVLVKRVSEEVLTIVRQDKEIQSGNTQKAIQLVEAKVLPYFNFQRMTALAMGRDWNRASAEQKKRLAEEFKSLLVLTYSNALTGYRDQTIRYRPTDIPAGATEARVRTEVVKPGSKPIQIDYWVERSDGGWKVYDVASAGVSLVVNYRSEFNAKVSADGIDGLIEMLVAKNKQNDPGRK